MNGGGENIVPFSKKVASQRWVVWSDFCMLKAVPQRQIMMNLSQKDYGKDVRVMGLALTLLGEWAFPNMPWRTKNHRAWQILDGYCPAYDRLLTALYWIYFTPSLPDFLFMAPSPWISSFLWISDGGLPLVCINLMTTCISDCEKLLSMVYRMEIGGIGLELWPLSPFWEDSTPT